MNEWALFQELFLFFQLICNVKGHREEIDPLSLQRGSTSIILVVLKEMDGGKGAIE